MYIPFLISFLLSVLFVYICWRFALQVGWFDRPNERSFHKTPTPRIGGIGLVLASLSALIWVEGRNETILILVGLMVAVVSLLDDKISLPRIVRFGFHGLAAILVLIFFHGWQTAGLPLLGHLPVIFLSILLIIWVAGLTNAYNFMDGIDGIAGWQGMVAGFGWFLFFYNTGHSESAIVAACLIAACFGFLVWNRPKARIFMGDVGSTYLGVVFATLPLLAIENGIEGEQAFEAGFLFVWPFILDTGMTFCWRFMKKEKVFEAHRSHCYQRLAATWEDRETGHWYSGLIFALLALLGVGLFFSSGPFWGKLGVIIGLWVAVVAWTHLRTSERKDSKCSCEKLDNAYPEKRERESLSKMNPRFTIPLCFPYVSEEEQKGVYAALNNQQIGPYGRSLADFEESLSHYYEGAGVALVSSGTAALHLSMLAVGIKQGDVVICPSYTFAATVNAARYCGAEPVFVDCSTDDWGIDIELLEKAIRELKANGKALKAVMLVHAYGIPAKALEIRAICDREGLVLVEDTAGALGSEQKKRQPVGLAGSMSGCSTNANKLVSTGSGGFVVSQDAQLIESARLHGNQGKADTIHYEHLVVGMNYRMSNLNAALGFAQWKNISMRLEAKERQFRKYSELLKDLPLTMMPQPEGKTHNHWMHGIVLDDIEALPIILEMREAGIEVAPLWKPMHSQPVYEAFPSYLNGTADKLYKSGMVLPSSFDLSDEEIGKIVEKLKSSLKVAV